MCSTQDEAVGVLIEEYDYYVRNMCDCFGYDVAVASKIFWSGVKVTEVTGSAATQNEDALYWEGIGT
jgi:hypothetical protein